MSRFPKITETFVLYEMKALEELGAHVEVFPLFREPPGPRHAEALHYEERAHFTPLVSPGIVRANLRRLFADPGHYLRTWWEMLSGTWGSLNFFLGALGLFPKCVAFAEHMRRLGVTHVHAHFANHPALAALVVHRFSGIPYSFTAHGSDLHVERRMLAEKVRSAAFVVAVSQYNRELIVAESGEDQREKIAIIHCGTDPSMFASVAGAAPARADGVEGSLRVACVARFEEVKGHRFLVHACRLLVDRGVDVRLDLAGDGPLRMEIEALVVELGLAGRVRVHGPVARDRVKEILDAADVAVLASYPTRSGKREGIPVALMEAMMSGLPVVASGLSGIPELVDHGETGFLVPPGDPWSLAQRLEALARDPELRRRLGAAARRKVLEEFDVHEGARRLLERVRRFG